MKTETEGQSYWNIWDYHRMNHKPNELSGGEQQRLHRTETPPHPSLNPEEGVR
jgi:ABC-type lipoprotein export system ATPase subunit